MKPATDAISALISNGIHVVGAAGNTGVDSCTTSPGAASSVGAITVASINWQDKMSSFSGWGKCVDLFAAGEQIQSVGIRSYVDSAVMSGTSMSSPQVAGVNIIIFIFPLMTQLKCYFKIEILNDVSCIYFVSKI